MTLLEIENQIGVLKGKQADHFKKKKADRNAEELAATRQQLNDLKKQATALTKKKK